MWQNFKVLAVAQDTLVLGAVQTPNKKLVPSPKSLQSKQMNRSTVQSRLLVLWHWYWLAREPVCATSQVLPRNPFAMQLSLDLAHYVL